MRFERHGLTRRTPTAPAARLLRRSRLALRWDTHYRKRPRLLSGTWPGRFATRSRSDTVMALWTISGRPGVCRTRTQADLVYWDSESAPGNRSRAAPARAAGGGRGPRGR